MTKAQVRALLAILPGVFLVLQAFGVTPPEWLWPIVVSTAGAWGIALPTPGKEPPSE
jgi:hypothetical protein